MNSTHSIILFIHISKNSEISFFTPISSPWVFDSPVVYAIFCAITNKKYGVINGCTTVSRNDAFLVIFESWSASVNSYWNWSKLKSLSKLLGVKSRNFREIREFYISWLSFSSTFIVWSLVWVLTLGFKFVMFDVIVCIFNKTSWATVVSIWNRAIKDLLFREKYVSSFLYLNRTLNWPSGGKTPAGATRALIFNYWHLSSSNPINGLRQCWCCIKHKNFILWLFSILFIPQHLLIFLVIQISKLAKLILLTLLSSFKGFSFLMLIQFLNIFDKSLKFVSKYFLCRVRLFIFSSPL